jgi:hypothetical protein
MQHAGWAGAINRKVRGARRETAKSFAVMKWSLGIQFNSVARGTLALEQATLLEFLPTSANAGIIAT